MKFRERLRAFELELQRRMPEFNCSVHLCLGQEDVPEIMAEMLKPQDWVFSTHRSHGHYLAKGGNEQALLAEIEGREDGINGGFSGSQSFCDPAIRFHSTAIVGGLIGVAAGAALAAKLQGKDEIAVCCIGDAATEQGIFWETLNFAALHKLPLVFLCENNGLSVHAPLRLRQAKPILPRVKEFGAMTWKGTAGVRFALDRSMKRFWPSFVELECKREGKHVSAMEDLRE